jgi:hypothetical protein
VKAAFKIATNTGNDKGVPVDTIKEYGAVQV